MWKKLCSPEFKLEGLETEKYQPRVRCELDILLHVLVVFVLPIFWANFAMQTKLQLGPTGQGGY